MLMEILHLCFLKDQEPLLIGVHISKWKAIRGKEAHLVKRKTHAHKEICMYI